MLDIIILVLAKKNIIVFFVMNIYICDISCVLKLPYEFGHIKNKIMVLTLIIWIILSHKKYLKSYLVKEILIWININTLICFNIIFSNCN